MASSNTNERTDSQLKADAQDKKPISEIYGSLSGKIWMSDDFDAPLEEMESICDEVSHCNCHMRKKHTNNG